MYSNAVTVSLQLLIQKLTLFWIIFAVSLYINLCIGFGVRG